MQRKASPQEHYRLLQRTLNPNKVLLLLQDTKSRHIRWTRHCHGLDPPLAWAKDHRALAFSFDDLYENPDPYGGGFHILYWREGHAPKELSYLAAFGEFDFATNIRWSPDDRRFTFVGGSSSQSNIGGLCCVDAVTGHFHLGASEVGYFQWAGSQRLWYIRVPLTPDHHDQSSWVRVPQHSRSWTGRFTYRRWIDADWRKLMIHIYGKSKPW